MYPLMTLEFYARDVYGMDLPNVTVKAQILRDVTHHDYTLPDEYSDEDRDRYKNGMWELVSVRVSLYNGDGLLVARNSTDGVEFGSMEERYVNPLSNPDDFPLGNLFWYCIDDYNDRGGLPL